MYFCDVENRESKEIAPGIHARTFWGEKMLLSMVELNAGDEVPPHSHPHEQCGAVFSGRVEFTIGGERRVLSSGDTYIVPGGVEHSVKVLAGPSRVLDVFSPVREAYQY